MRKLMGVTAALLLLTAGSAAAQSGTGTVGASATVLASLTTAPAGDLNFGGAIAPTAGPVDVVPGTAGAGAIQITHNSAFSTAVTSASTHLTRSGGSTPLPVTFNCAYGTSATGGTIAGTQQACNGMANRAVTTLGTSQVTFLQVGGQLTIPANVEPGSYTGSISFTFTATGF